MKQLFFGLLLAALGCSPGLAQPDVLKVGTIQPLTGPYAFAGADIKAGMEIWTDEANKAGGILGRKVQLIIADSQSDPRQAVAAAQSLLNRDRVDLIVGACCGTSIAPLASLQADYPNVPILLTLGRASPRTPEWARFGEADVAKWLDRGRNPLNPAAFQTEAAYRQFTNRAERDLKHPPSQFTLLGYSVMQATADALKAAKDPHASLAVLAALRSPLAPITPNYDTVNAPACPIGQCRPATCSGGASPCPCQNPPCS
jgi:ABC-type branched-subunit amino acid transport system substrate-binding protein